MNLSLFDKKTGRALGVLEWDEETGELAGELAPRVLQLVELAEADGEVWIEPHPATIAIDRPLESREQLAAILGLEWRCPELADDYPTVEDTGADVEGVIY